MILLGRLSFAAVKTVAVLTVLFAAAAYDDAVERIKKLRRFGDLKIGPSS
jgi:hypothetical protein